MGRLKPRSGKLLSLTAFSQRPLMRPQPKIRRLCRGSWVMPRRSRRFSFASISVACSSTNWKTDHRQPVAPRRGKSPRRARIPTVLSLSRMRRRPRIRVQNLIISHHRRSQKSDGRRGSDQLHKVTKIQAHSSRAPVWSFCESVRNPTCFAQLFHLSLSRSQYCTSEPRFTTSSLAQCFDLFVHLSDRRLGQVIRSSDRRLDQKLLFGFEDSDDSLTSGIDVSIILFMYGAWDCSPIYSGVHNLTLMLLHAICLLYIL